MPLEIDILENRVLGREYKRGKLEGKIEGKLEGKIEGKLEGEREGELRGELTIFRRLIGKRFGAVSAWAEERIGRLTAREIEDLSVRVLDAESLEDLLR